MTAPVTDATVISNTVISNTVISNTLDQENTMTAPVISNTVISTPGRMDYVPSTNWRFDVRFDFADATWDVTERHQSEGATSFYDYYGNAQSFTLPDNTDASQFA